MNDQNEKTHYASDYDMVRGKAGKDKRLTDKRQRKAMKAYRDARKNRHNFS